jgi:hypothetical protein
MGQISFLWQRENKLHFPSRIFKSFLFQENKASKFAKIVPGFLRGVRDYIWLVDFSVLEGKHYCSKRDGRSDRILEFRERSAFFTL